MKQNHSDYFLYTYLSTLVRIFLYARFLEIELLCQTIYILIHCIHLEIFKIFPEFFIGLR